MVSQGRLRKIKHSRPKFLAQEKGKEIPGDIGNHWESFRIILRRDCVRIVAEIFDPTGRITPLTASMKLDICELTIR